MPAELPSWNGPSDATSRLIETIDTWTAEGTLASLVAAFGARRDLRSLDELDEFAAAHWDFRRGRERNLAAHADLSADQVAAIAAATPRLGLSGIRVPRRMHYDTIIMTGGMVRAGIVKPRYVATLFSRGITARRVVFLGAFRPFAGDEVDVAASLGVVGHDEVDAMTEGVTRAFDGLGDGVHDGAGRRSAPDAWGSTRWSWEGTEIEVLAAPSSAPFRRRADTADTYAFWLDRAAPQPGHRVLIVTTPIYVPYQGARAVEVLGLGSGLRVDTVGADDAAQDLGRDSQIFTPAHHLQELRAAIGAMRSLRAAAMA